MERHHKFTAAAKSLQPIVIEFDDGRRFEFPPDMPALGWLEFITKWGNAEAEASKAGPDEIPEEMPVDQALDMFHMIFGDDKLTEVASQTSLTELALIAAAVYAEYMGLLAAIKAEAGKARSASTS